MHPQRSYAFFFRKVRAKVERTCYMYTAPEKICWENLCLLISLLLFSRLDVQRQCFDLLDAKAIFSWIFQFFLRLFAKRIEHLQISPIITRLRQVSTYGLRLSLAKFRWQNIWTRLLPPAPLTLTSLWLNDQQRGQSHWTCEGSKAGFSAQDDSFLSFNACSLLIGL